MMRLQNFRWHFRDIVYRSFLSVRQLHPATFLAILIIAFGFYCRFEATKVGLPYSHRDDEPEILNASIRVLRDGVYRPVRYSYGPVNTYLHAAWGVLSYLGAMKAGELGMIWDLKTDWDTGWYWTISSPYYHRQGRLLSVIMWLVTVLAVWATCRTMGLRWGGVVAVSALSFSSENLTQTTLILPNVCGTMFTSIALWAGLSYASEKEKRWNRLLGCAASAGAAVAAKLVFVPVLFVPVCCYLCRALKFKEPIQLWAFVGVVIVAVGTFAALMISIFFDPPRFMHSLWELRAAYVKNTGQIQFLDHLLHSLKAGAASLDVMQLGAADGSYQITSINPAQLIYLLLATVGVIAFIKRPVWGIVVIGLAFLNLWHITSYRGAFYFRNVMISQLCFVLAAAYGTELVINWTQRHRVRKLLLGTILCLSVVPAYRVWSIARDTATVVDSRVVAESKLRELIARGKRVLICSELRWFYAPWRPEDRSIFPQASVARLFRHPHNVAPFDYVVVPLELTLRDRDSAQINILATWNELLRKLKTEQVFGVDPTYIDRYSVCPKLAIVPAREFANIALKEDSRIYGAEFEAPHTDESCFLTDKGIAMSAYFLGSAQVRLSKPCSEVLVAARGMNPFPQNEFPRLFVDIFSTTDTAQKVPVAKLMYELYLGGGLREYAQKVTIPPGSYTVFVSAKNPERRFMTELGFIEFR
ncbi:MAG: glycosyltransferase family 39 protein [Candidatus Sumerlaeaceae bacterium]|nr:glycosyltransferase family 39 protein [Candidatus Sumerlaeaceae bacterium]